MSSLLNGQDCVSTMLSRFVTHQTNGLTVILAEETQLLAMLLAQGLDSGALAGAQGQLLYALHNVGQLFVRP